jgi:hypothetical protein
VTGRKPPESVRLVFFLATGLAVPLYAFPLFRILGREVDLATILAALFVLSSLLAVSYRRSSVASRVWLGAAAVVPALVLIPPSFPAFQLSGFLVSHGHWLLVSAFFFFSLSLQTSERTRTRVALWNLLAGTAVALFAIYQVVGIPRHWPGTGTVLAPFQREPLRLTRASYGSPYTRPTSVFLEPAWMGGYLTWVFVLGFTLAFLASKTVGPRARFFARAGVALILFAIAASVSWGSYADFAAAVGAGLVILILGRRFRFRRKSLAVAVAVAGVVLALAAVSPPGRRVARAVSDRWTQLTRTPITESDAEPPGSDSSWVRARNLAYTAGLFRGHAARGIGLGQLASYAKSEETSSPSFRRDPWCGWVAIGAQMGVLGPLVLLAALVLILARWRRNRSGGVEDVAVPALLALALVQQLHTGSYLDLWWWYPVSVAAVLSGPVSARRS